MNGLFFTGTDTGVGKTFVLAGVVRLLRRQGKPFFRVMKPVATGAAEVNGSCLADDTVLLAEAAGLGPPQYAQVTRWAFRPPVAPSVAARLEGVALSVAAIAAEVRPHGQPPGVVLVEGVGGLLCPLTDTETVADLAAELALPLVVVARRSLGTLNHTLLTLEAARQRGLDVAGVIVNQTTPVSDLADQTNVEELGRWLKVPLLAVVPYEESGVSSQESGIWNLAEIDWWSLSHRQARAS